MRWDEKKSELIVCGFDVFMFPLGSWLSTAMWSATTDPDVEVNPAVWSSAPTIHATSMYEIYYLMEICQVKAKEGNHYPFKLVYYAAPVGSRITHPRSVCAGYGVPGSPCDARTACYFAMLGCTACSR